MGERSPPLYLSHIGGSYMPGSLTLSRKKGERIYIGDEIIIDVRKLTKGRAILNITAPKELKIYREEVYHKVKEEVKDLDKYFKGV